MSSPKTLNSHRLLQDVSDEWDRDIIAQLSRFISIPAKSPAFDPAWEANGYIGQVVRDAAAWIEAQSLTGAKVEILQLPHRTPVLFFDIASTCAEPCERSVLIYGHLDKQPEFSGWRADLHPWKATLEGDRLYGRGSADDGYAVYAGIAAVRALQRQKIPHPRIVGVIETCEESGSCDLPAYLELLHPRMGEVALVACLDSGAGNYDQLWLTTSLRGMLSGALTVQVLTEGVHSGEASGIVPSSFRILRILLDRIEDSATGRILLPELHCDIPAAFLSQAGASARILGEAVCQNFPWARSPDATHAHTLPARADPVEQLLARTWRPALSVTGAAGLPPRESAGNVLRPATTLKLSLRLPPLVDAQQAMRRLQQALECRAPYQAQVHFTPEQAADGWCSSPLPQWYDTALCTASQSFFGAPFAALGQGGSIPLINMLARHFPHAQMMVCGVLGPHSNAHGPNEFLHIPYAKKLTACVAQVIAAVPVAVTC